MEFMNRVHEPPSQRAGRSQKTPFEPHSASVSTTRATRRDGRRLRVLASSLSTAAMSVAERVLSISETLGLIFSYAERQDTARCARVCRAWLDPALDTVWQHLDGFAPLLALLAPLCKDPDRRYVRLQLRAETLN